MSDESTPTPAQASWAAYGDRFDMVTRTTAELRRQVATSSVIIDMNERGALASQLRELAKVATLYADLLELTAGGPVE